MSASSVDPRSEEETAIRDFDAEIRITPREGLLDPEGETIAGALERLGHERVRRVRAGRLVRLRLRAEDAGAALREVREMCDELIANPVTEDFDVRVRPSGAEDAERDRGDGAGGERSGPGEDA